MEEGQTEQPRSIGARIGIAALNLLTPGLGLLRLGRLRSGLAFALGGLAWVLGLAGAAADLPELTPTGLLVVLGLSLVALPLLYLASILIGWRPSRTKALKLAWWSKWYGLAAVFAVMAVGSNLVVELAHSFYRPFYIPAQSMDPTLSLGERFVADMRVKKTPQRGDVILLKVADAIYVKRVAALPGDTIEMRAGVPIVNGVSASERALEVVQVRDLGELVPGRVFLERLPGESDSHRIMDLGESRTDDMPPARVPAGHLFVLGDNRDRSADSRVPRAEGGIEMAPMGDVVGRPLFKTWSGDWRWLGNPIR